MRAPLRRANEEVPEARRTRGREPRRALKSFTSDSTFCVSRNIVFTYKDRKLTVQRFNVQPQELCAEPINPVDYFEIPIQPGQHQGEAVFSFKIKFTVDDQNGVRVNNQPQVVVEPIVQRDEQHTPQNQVIIID